MGRESLTQGRLQILSDINKQKLDGKSQTLDLQIRQWYKNMKTYLRFSGVLKFVCQSSDTESGEKTFDLRGTYKSDHFYNMVSSLVIRLNSSYEVRNYAKLSFLRYFNLLTSEGYANFENLPKSVTIPSGKTEAEVSFDFVVPIHFTMQDMQGRERAFIATWLYNAIQITLENNGIEEVFDLTKLETKHTGLSVDFKEKWIESTSAYWITKPNPFNASDLAEVTSAMGGNYKVTSFPNPVFMGSKDFVIDQFTPTTNVNLTGFLIVCRDPETGERVDGVIDRLKFADGDRPLFECDPIFLKQFTREKYNFSRELWNKSDSSELDGMGALYGVIKVDTTFFGELANSMLAVGNWNRPKLYVSMKPQGANGYTKDRVTVEIYQLFYEVPEITQKQAINYVASTQGA